MVDSLPLPNTTGLNESNYVKSDWVEAEINLKDMRLDDRARRRADLARALHDSALRSDIRSFLGDAPLRWDALSATHLAPLIDSADVVALARRDGLLSRFLNITEHAAITNCRAGTYTYGVRLWVLRNPILATPPQARATVQRHVDDYVDRMLADVITRGGTVTIPTKALFDVLYADSLRAELRVVFASGDTTYLRYIGPSARLFIHSIIDAVPVGLPFSSGHYAVSDDMAYIIELIVHRLIDLRSPSAQHWIISKGYADANPVDGPIAYDGKADLSLRVDEVAPLEQTGHATALRTNDELSIARGYAGALQVRDVLARERISTTGAGSIAVAYAGGGVVPGPIRDAHRRIDLVITTVLTRSTGGAK